ncbi:unnamed protein product [Chrysoparadoxa australica]
MVILQGDVKMALKSNPEADALGPAQTFRCVSFADEMNPHRRNTMEDAHRMVSPFDGDPTKSYFAVYDGHGGRGLVDFLETRLEENVASELRMEGDGSVLDCLSSAFLTTDMESKQANIVTSGRATACVLLLHKQDATTTMYVANVGDSRAVLSDHGKASRLTYDHKAEDEGERKRIEDAGGFILRNRVLGILAVSRSFGDHGMKEFVTAQPHTKEIQLGSAEGHPFVIVACDGIWDVFSDQEGVDMVKGCVDRGEENVAAAMLVQEALDRGSTDNITVIIIFF